MKRVVWFAFVILSTLVVVILLWQFSISIVLFVLSLAISAALRPSLLSLMDRGHSRTFALGIVYSVLVFILVLLLIAISQPVFLDAQKIAEDFSSGYERIKTEWPRGGTLFQQALAEQLPPTKDLYEALTSEEGITALTGVFGIAQNFFTLLGRIAIAIILSIYWSADQNRFEHLALSLFPPEYHMKARKVWRSVETGVGAYVRSELIQSLLAGIILGIGYAFMHVRYPAVLALWVAIARLIPWFGTMIAVLPPLLVGIGTSPGLGIVVCVYTLGVLLWMKLVIEPHFFLRNHYNSLLIVLFVIALAEAFGIIGVMLAPPLAVAVQIFFAHVSPAPYKLYGEEKVEQVEELQRRLARIQRRLATQPKPVPQETLAEIEQVHHLTNQLIDHLQKF